MRILTLILACCIFLNHCVFMSFPQSQADVYMIFLQSLLFPSYWLCPVILRWERFVDFKSCGDLPRYDVIFIFYRLFQLPLIKWFSIQRSVVQLILTYNEMLNICLKTHVVPLEAIRVSCDDIVLQGNICILYSYCSYFFFWWNCDDGLNCWHYVPKIFT